MADPITKSIIVMGSLEDVFNLWANFETFPMFMKDIKSVTKLDDRLSHWVMQGPLGTVIEWDADTTTFEPHRCIGWNSKDHGPITTSGQVTFAELGLNETEVTVTLKYDPPAGLAGEVVAALFASPEKRLEDDLRRFKTHVESTSERLHNTGA
ncbi:MAG: SRPBCC family protein [Anaerolineales bacterium]